MTDPSVLILAVGLPTALHLLAVAAGFAAVFLFVVAMFGHTERTEMSPQRRIALATGQADRQTVFESDALAPVMWLLLQLSESLAIPRTKRWVRRTLVAAGSPNFYSAEEFLALAMLWGLIGAAGANALHWLIFQNLSVVAAIFGLFAGFSLTLYWIYDRSRRRVREISRRVPYTLDLLALAKGAGSTFTEAVATVVREEPSHPFNRELATMLSEVDLGTTRRQSLRNLADRVPLESLRSIVASVIQAEELGTPLTEVLKGQANLLRLQRSVQAEKKAAQASVRILLPSTLLLLAVVLTIFAPLILRAIRGDLF
jgi:tight adherence protein C